MLVLAVALSAVACVLAVCALWRTRTGARRSGAVGQARVTTSDGALTRVAVVRYDAFTDIAGQLSFSAALLDDDGDGLVLSSIHARAESRTYAKSIESGGSSVELSPEEKQAVAAARAGTDLS